MQQQIDSASTAIFGLITSVIAFTFDINAPTFFAGMWGSIVAVGFFEAGMTRWQGLMLIIAGTVTSGYCFGYVSHLAPSLPSTGAAFVTALLVIPNRKLIMDGFKGVIGAAFSGAKARLSGRANKRETSE